MKDPGEGATSRGVTNNLARGVDVGKRICSAIGCNRKAKARGWCETHYTRWRKYGDPNVVKQVQGFDIVRLMEKVEIQPGGCWLWLACVTQTGYGQFRFRGKLTPAHRASYVLHRGAIPPGAVLDHLCRVRRCVNPDHLEPVDQRTNLLRGIGWAAVNASKTHCVNGHEFTAENTYVNPSGRRHCRICRKSQRRAHLERTGN